MRTLLFLLSGLLCAAAQPDKEKPFSVRAEIGFEAGRYVLEKESRDGACASSDLKWAEVEGMTSLELGPKIVFYFESQRALNESGERTGVSLACETTTEVHALPGEARRVEKTDCSQNETMTEITTLKKEGSTLIYSYQRTASAGLQEDFIPTRIECRFKKANL